MTTDQTSRNRARELQLDALLHEAAGVLPAPDLTDRIREAIAAGVTPALQLPRHRRLWLLAAALFAAGVVGGVAWLQRDHGGAAVAATQEPQEPTEDARPEIATTLIADYSDNRVIEVDAAGKVLFELQDVFGAWDAEKLPSGNYLITEFSVSRVTERTPQGEVVWRYEKLKNPYDADLLPNGNVLIADTFGGRVIEVKPDRKSGQGGKVVWSYGDKGGIHIRPFDADRLPNGDTLIADVLGDRVVQVDPKGTLVWRVPDVPNPHDADRLPNGHTLVTLRSLNAVVEFDRDGIEVWRLEELASPSDADRLPNGNTLVAQNGGVIEYDKDGKEVWRQDSSWTVEANRYYRTAPAPKK